MENLEVCIYLGSRNQQERSFWTGGALVGSFRQCGD